MNLAEFLKFAHILAIVIGFGGMIALHATLPVLTRASTVPEARTLIRLGRIFDATAGVGIVLGGLVGLGLSLYQEWDFGENMWLNIAATLWIVAIVLAGATITPGLGRLSRLVDAEEGSDLSPETREQLASRRLVWIASAVTVFLLVILFLMVAKPGVDFSGIDNWPVNS
jgi:hypothetical protein